VFREETAVLSIVLAVAGCGGKTHAGEGNGIASGGACAPIPGLTPAAILDPSCPARVPEIGEVCDRIDLVCAYERCLTAGKSDVVFTCNNGSFFWEDNWYCEPNSSDCPDCLPAEGGACPRIGQACRYGPGVKAGCEHDGWRVWEPDRYPLP